MALVRNTLDHELTLTVGTLGPRAQANIDATLPYEASLVLDGTLAIVDGSTPPPEPAEPFIDRARPVYVGQTQPTSLPISGVWFDKTAGAWKERTATSVDVLQISSDPMTVFVEGPLDAAAVVALNPPRGTTVLEYSGSVDNVVGEWVVVHA